MEKAERIFWPTQYVAPSWTQVRGVCFGLNSYFPLTPACFAPATDPAWETGKSAPQDTEVKPALGAQPFSPVFEDCPFLEKPAHHLSGLLACLISQCGGEGFLLPSCSAIPRLLWIF